MSPPRSSNENSLHAFLNPVDNSIICFFEIFFGIVTEIIQNFGSIPFAAKSLTLETTLFLAMSIKFDLGGMSVLSTKVSIFEAHIWLPIRKISTSSGVNFLL